MKIGMLWFDNSNSPFSVKVEKACDYYENRYGKRPNACWVHPATAATQNEVLDKLEIKISRSILPNHFWIGVE